MINIDFFSSKDGKTGDTKESSEFRLTQEKQIKVFHCIAYL